jgi:hypothetical protein
LPILEVGTFNGDFWGCGRATATDFANTIAQPTFNYTDITASHDTDAIEMNEKIPYVPAVPNTNVIGSPNHLMT